MLVVLFVMSAMGLLAPNRDHTELGGAISRVVLEEKPLFRGDESKLRTAALVVAIAFRESSLRNDISSKTDDWCAMQVNRRPDLAKDPEACIRVGMTMLRESMRICPAHPIAFYASGPGGCDNARAQRISRDRMTIAARLVREVKP